MTPSVLQVGLSVMEGLDCPRSLTVAILLRSEEWDQLVELAFDPSLYLTSDDAWRANQATELFRKMDGLPTSYDLEAKAIKSFWECENQCFNSNQRLLPLLFGRNDEYYSAELHDFVDSVKSYILSWIGSGPPDNYHESGGFGPGATISDRSTHTTVADKLSSVPTLTRDTVYHLFPWMGTEWGKVALYLGNEPKVVRGNAFFTVPKSATSLRGCGKEPSINVFYQKAIGLAMRRRLKRAGLDLTEGKEIHMRAACKSSQDDLQATIDLSSASDTVCINLVKLMLPRRWFEVLNDLRSKFTLVQGRTVWLEKFSSMGNGFTFELETILFAAISMAAIKDDKATLGKDCLVFGDDIIVPKDRSSDVLSALSFFGFTPNKRKTFTQGCFRESCGGDFFSGVSVRAHYWKKEPSAPEHWISLMNGLRRSCEADFEHRWGLLKRAWLTARDNIPSEIRRCRGPRELGDLVIHCEESQWSIRWRSNGIRYLRVYRPASLREVKWEGFAYEVQFACALYLVDQKANEASLNPALDKSQGGRLISDLKEVSRPDRTRMGNLIPRDPVLGYKIGWVPYS